MPIVVVASYRAAINNGKQECLPSYLCNEKNGFMAHKSDDVTLHEILVFRDLASEEVDEIEQLAFIENFAQNDIICREGDSGDCLYIVKSGQVRISKITPLGAEKVLSRLGPRSFFGEMSLIDGQPRSACAIADSQTSLFCVYKTEMDKLVERNSLTALKVISAFAKVLSYRLRKMNEELLELFSEPDRTIREIMESENRLMKYMLISGWYYEGPE